MTRAVLFDFYGTLARATEWGPNVEDVLAEHGVGLDRDAFDRWHAEAADGVDHIEHSTDRERYVAWERARLTRLAEGCGAAAPEEVVDALYRAVKTYTLEAYDEVPAVLAELRSRGVVLAVCSNWDWDLDRAIERSGLGGAFDVTVTSAQAGVRKPHPRIYRHTLERCGDIAPRDVMFVGDTWEPDVEGPRRAGMCAVQVWRDAAPPPNGTARIPDLRGVLDLVD